MGAEMANNTPRKRHLESRDQLETSVVSLEQRRRIRLPGFKRKRKKLRKQSQEGRERRCERRCVKVERDEWICFAPQQKNASQREMQWDNIEERRRSVTEAPLVWRTSLSQWWPFPPALSHNPTGSSRRAWVVVGVGRRGRRGRGVAARKRQCVCLNQ